MTRMTTADFAPLYPPYIWIPASAGMTEESVRLRRTEGLVVSPNLKIPLNPPLPKGDLGGFGGQGVEKSMQNGWQWQCGGAP